MRYKNNYGRHRFRGDRMSITLVICFVFLASLPSVSQSISAVSLTDKKISGYTQTPVLPAPLYTELAIGEDMPDIGFRMLNFPAEKAHAAEFRGKLLLLDFWATWCGSCIAKFPTLDSLQNKYKDQVQIILVNCKSTGDTEKQINEFFTKRKNPNTGKPYQLAIASMDTDAESLFPHKEIPHYAWIGPDGRIKAITSAHEVTGKNIEAIVDHRKTKMIRKRDFSPDKLMDLGQEGFPIDDNLAHYSLFRKGRLEGLSMVNQTRAIDDQEGVSHICGKAMRNMPLLDMYTEAIYQKPGTFRDTYSDRRLVLELKHPYRLVFDPARSSKDEWEKENVYTYDLVIPFGEQDSLYNYIVDDLGRYSGFYGRIEKRKTKYWALVRTSGTDKIKTKGGSSENKLYNDAPDKIISNLPVSQLLWRLERLDGFKMPVIDETGYKGNIDLELNVNLNDALAVRKALQKYNLDLVQKEKLLDVFVITEK